MWNDRRDDYDDWLEKASAAKKERDELWAAAEEERQRAEDRRKGAFKERIKRDRKRFAVRRKMEGRLAAPVALSLRALDFVCNSKLSYSLGVGSNPFSIQLSFMLLM